MVDSNIQRERILPSEKAFALMMKMDAMKHQGFRSDLISDQNDLKCTLDQKKSKDRSFTCWMNGRQGGESVRSVEENYHISKSKGTWRRVSLLRRKENTNRF